MNHEEPTDFLVIGAGLGGIAFATEVQAAGRTVRLLDKGRSVGGRIATRRWETPGGNTLRVDHGAPYIALQSARGRAIADAGRAEGWLQPCLDRLEYREMVKADDERGEKREVPGAFQLAASPFYTSARGMNEIAKRLSSDLTIHTNFTAIGMRRENQIWRVTGIDMDGNESRFAGRSLILNLPTPLLRVFAADWIPAALLSDLEAVRYAPTWTLILRLGDDLKVSWDALRLTSHPALKWIIRDHVKRGADAPPVLVVHATPDWSRKFLEEDKPTVEAALRAALEEVLEAEPVILAAQLHRWRYAYPETFFPDPFFWQLEIQVGGCGDWASTGRGENQQAEGALESGWGLAERVLAN